MKNLQLMDVKEAIEIEWEKRKEFQDALCSANRLKREYRKAKLNRLNMWKNYFKKMAA